MTDPDCLFCKIIAGEVPSKKVYEDDTLIAFDDINPQAPTHILICPKKHIDRISNMGEDDKQLVGEVIHRSKEIAREKGISDFRLVFNNGRGSGQAVFHIHLHLLGGRPMTWPPG